MEYKNFELLNMLQYGAVTKPVKCRTEKSILQRAIDRGGTEGYVFNFFRKSQAAQTVLGELMYANHACEVRFSISLKPILSGGPKDFKLGSE